MTDIRRADKLAQRASEKTLKTISTQLEAPNTGTNKMFININGKTSKIETNENAKIQYKLNNPFKLEVGDKVTLYQAFVNEAGLNTDTISFQEDINTTVKFLYYMPSQCFKNAEPTTATKTVGTETGEAIQGDGAAACLSIADYQDFTTFPNRAFLIRDPAHADTSGAYDNHYNYRDIFSELGIPFSNVFSGDIGTPYYLFENHWTGNLFPERSTTSNTYIKPAYGEVTINIPAGNYEASSLAKNITEQFNGAFVPDTNNSNYLTDRLYNPDSNNYAGTDTDNPFGSESGKATTRVFFQGTNQDLINTGGSSPYDLVNLRNRFDNGILRPDMPGPLISDMFINPDGLELWLRNTSNVQLYGDFLVNSNQFARISVPLDGSNPKTYVGNTPAEAVGHLPQDVETYGWESTQDLFIQYCCNNLLLNLNSRISDQLFDPNTGQTPSARYCGTHSFTVSYSDDKANRFSLKNLHEPYKLPSITKTNDVNNFAAQQATKYNASNFVGNVCYPIEASMGLMVTNFGHGQVLQTKKYKQLKELYDDNLSAYGPGDRRTLIAEWNLNTTRFKDFFSSEREAREAWSTTLWSRLGFTYEQFGDIEPNLETVQTIKPFDNPNFANKMTQQRLDKWGVGKQKLKGIITHNDFDFSDIQACANLGGFPVTLNGNNVNMFDSLTFAKQNFETLRLETTRNGGSGDFTLMDISKNNTFSNIATSQSIDANKLPDLNAGNSYYLITSDIIKPNGLDANGDPMNLIGIMSKENSSNDTIFSVDGVPNIITEPKLVSELSIEVKNPDNSVVPDSIIGKSSGFILLVEKAINPGAMETKSF